MKRIASALSTAMLGITLTFGGSHLTVDQQGRVIMLNGRSVDSMPRQQLLEQLHELAHQLLKQYGQAQ